MLKKLASVFEHNPQIRHFDTLVGYFRSSGYFKIRPYLDNIPEIRILVGIDVDKLTEKYHREGLALLSVGDKQAAVADYQEKLKKEIENADYNQQTEQSILRFMEDIISKKIILRAHPTRKLHAKIYIFRPDNFNQHSSGEVITGSSNLSETGLGVTEQERAANYEFNVSLRDYDDVRFATEEFKKLWEESTDILPQALQAVKEETFLRDNFSPFELYIKLLIEYFGKEINFNPDEITDLPEGFKRLAYQLDAVNQGFEILKKHNGFFLSDVVGLGKTVIAVLIARIYFFYNKYPEHRSHTLIVTPPIIKDNWQETINKFKLDNVRYITTGRLHQIKNPEKYDMIIVDEAHKFRNDTSDAYQNLQRICKTPTESGQAKKIILVSATPLNNRPNDIRNQLLLFQDGNNSTLDINISSFFSRINKTYEELMQPSDNDKEKEMAAIARLYEEVRKKIIEPLTVRRTRTDLLEHDLYSKDLEKQNIVFPNIEEPHISLYPLDENLNRLYDETMKKLTNKKEGLSYMRYRAIEYLKPEHQKDYSRASFFSGQLAHIMKCLLVKRMDSSFHAFRHSLRRFLNASEAMLTMIKNNRIIIAPEHKINEYINSGREEELLQILSIEQLKSPNIKFLARDDFKNGFIEGIKKDHAILSDLYEQWEAVKEDPKMDEFLSILDNEVLNEKRNPNKKLIIFSEAKDTTDYLNEKLSAKYRVISVNSENRNNRDTEIRQNFDANAATQKDDYDILITTEVMAEGINLHRANSVLNYDTPWNATRLMQRIGRVNRIGGKHRNIHIYNFLPTEKVDGDINLRKKAHIKLQSFHSAFGEDSQIYTTDEDTGTFGLFEKNPQGDAELSERLRYLMEIREFRKNHADEFRRIKNLPLKIRNGVANEPLRAQTISFLRNKKHNAFYKVDEESEVEELGFLEAAPIFKCERDAKAVPLHEKHHSQVAKAIKHFNQQAQQRIFEQAHGSGHLSPQHNSAIAYLKSFINLDITTGTEKQQIRQAIELIRMGRFQHLPKDINKLMRDAKKKAAPLSEPLSELLDKLIKVIEKYAPEAAEKDTTPQTPTKTEEPKIIISQSYS